ncbi:MAG: helix-turn-helix transcriptional regulator [bacterium]
MEAAFFLNQALRKSGLSKADISRKMGVSRTYITQLMKKDANPSWNTIREFLGICGYSAGLYIKKDNENHINVPDFLKSLFWDTNIEKIDAFLHKCYIFKRILNSGNTKAWEWLFRNYSQKQIIYFIAKNYNQLDSRSLNYWAIIFNKERQWRPLLQKIRSKNWRKLKSIG